MDKGIRQAAHRIIDALPEATRWEDLMHAVYVRVSIEEGLADAKAGRVISDADLRLSFGLEAESEE